MVVLKEKRPSRQAEGAFQKNQHRDSIASTTQDQYRHLPVGDHRAPCPACDRGRKDTALSITIKPDNGMVAHCFRCGYVATEKGTSYAPPRVTPLKQRRTSLSDWGRELWAQCLPVGGIAADYLRARHCVIPPADGDLRWHPQVKHPSGHTGPALIGLVTHARTCKPLSLHRTWITATGKADVSPSRMPLASHSLADGVIRLWPDEAVTHGLGVAEGIETALSLAHAFTPAWALIDAGHLGKFAPLPGIESLTIACDNDPAGITAARQCAAQWAGAGVEVYVTRQEVNDLNDMIREAA